MKLKYYLRGFGLGILLTAILMIIVTHNSRKELSNAEIINKAEALGMVMKEDNSKDSTNGNKEKKESNATTVDQQIKANDEKKQVANPETTTPPQEFIAIIVQRGEVSETIADKLQNAGVVPDAKVFNKYLTDNNYADNLQTGTFNIPKGASQEEIAKILTSKH